MLNILVMESLPKTLEVFVWASNKFREATALRKKVARASKGEDPLVTVGFQVIEEGAEPVFAVLSRSQVEAVKNQQPLKDGIAHMADMQRVASVQRAMGVE